MGFRREAFVLIDLGSGKGTGKGKGVPGLGTTLKFGILLKKELLKQHTAF